MNMDWIKTLTHNTGLESPARWFYRKLSPVRKSEWLIRVERDQQRLSTVLSKLLTTNSNCIDIGSHRGSFLNLFKKYSPNGSHFAFEPIPDLFLELKQQFPDVNIQSAALSNVKGESIFHKVRDGLAWSGLKLQEYPKEMQIEKIIVQTDLLDNILPARYQPDFIKIDVEGAELEVLEGSKMLMSKHKPTVFFEHALIHNKQYGTNPDVVFEFFKEYKMTMYTCDLKNQLTKREFSDIYYASYESNYDREGETNFIALESLP